MFPWLPIFPTEKVLWWPRRPCMIWPLSSLTSAPSQFSVTLAPCCSLGISILPASGPSMSLLITTLSSDNHKTNYSSLFGLGSCVTFSVMPSLFLVTLLTHPLHSVLSRRSQSSRGGDWMPPVGHHHRPNSITGFLSRGRSACVRRALSDFQCCWRVLSKGPPRGSTMGLSLASSVAVIQPWA